MDAAERLLRLDLKGAAQRDVPRVVLHCCLQETSYNPFYALVMARVARVSKSHRTTLEFMVRLCNARSPACRRLVQLRCAHTSIALQNKHK